MRGDQRGTDTFFRFFFHDLISSLSMPFFNPCLPALHPLLRMTRGTVSTTDHRPQASLPLTLSILWRLPCFSSMSLSLWHCAV